ncbi:MAG: homoserine dehydrogenase [Spirochaetaceae bacterium]|nr:MAG: homoserine dehydrogenase [Spirochaetaceae bacterium]
MERVEVGLVGLGTVGSGFFELMSQNGNHFASKMGSSVEIVRVAEIDTVRAQKIVPKELLVDDYRRVIEDDEIRVVVEMVGGTTVAYDIIRAAIEAGKHVITANKALLALKGAELFALARNKQVELKFEAAVGGGIPIIKVVRESLVGNRIDKVMGILNGTSNYILTQMSEKQLPFEEALKQAQTAGFAEADPSLDVGGGDAAHKICLLASFAFGGWVDYRRILCEGITSVTPGEIEFAASAGFAIKLIASAMRVDGKPSVTVFPALVPDRHPLASVRNEVNAVYLECDFLGPALFLGRGAGAKATASSVASDLGDLVQSLVLHARRGGYPFDPSRELDLHPDQEMEYRLFFHFITENRPGIWAAVTGCLAENGINIESVHQKWEDRSKPSDLYVLVDEAKVGQASKALREASAESGISTQSRFYRILPL